MQGRFPTIPLLSLLGAIAFATPVAAHDMFRTMDTNHDGKISAAEHTAGAKAMFDRMDADHDGKITAAECDAGHAKMEQAEAKEKGGMHHEMAEHHKSGADMVKMLDTDGDGTVSASEHDAWATKMFSDADANHDGNLTMAEMKSAHAKMDMDADDKDKTRDKGTQ